MLYKNLMSLGFGIEGCIEKKLTPPALILLYSAITFLFILYLIQINYLTCIDNAAIIIT